MRKWEIAWAVMLGGLPFSSFFMRNWTLTKSLDIWHGQSAWMQFGLIILLGLFLADGLKFVSNVPLAAWLTWNGLVWFWINYTVVQEKNIFPASVSFGYLHCLLIAAFILIATATWTEMTIDRLIKTIGVSGIVVMFYCLLQVVNLDQFFHSIDPSDPKDYMVGVIGNPSHLAAYLSMLVPIYIYLGWHVFSLLCIGLLLATQSAGAVVGASLACCYFFFQHNRILFTITLICCIAAAVLVTNYYPSYLDSHGRTAAWKEYWTIYVNSKATITGMGVGFVSELSKQIKDGNVLWQWRHVHCEPFQVMIEQGIIGFIAVGWILADSIHKGITHVSRKMSMCMAILLAFLANSLVNFPAHLWLLGSLGLFSYCGIIVLSRKESTC